MQPCAVALVTRVGISPDEIDQSRAAEVVSEVPGSSFVEPHQWGVKRVSLIHSKADRDLQGLDRIIPAIRIARVIGFAHPTYDVPCIPLESNRSSYGQEQQISAWDEGVWEPGASEFNLSYASQRGVADLAQYAEVDHVIFAESVDPLGKGLLERREKYSSYFKFDGMGLAIVESDCFYMLKALQRPSEARCRVLASGK